MSMPTARALAGWKRSNAKRGIVLTLQLAESGDRSPSGEFERLDLLMNDRQLRSLARDLARGAEARGISLYDKRPWWRFWRRERD